MLSGAVASIQIIAIYWYGFGSLIVLFSLGTLAPFTWLDLTGMSIPMWLGVGITIGLWSFLGVLLGKFTNKLGIAVLIWLTIQIILGISIVPLLNVA